MREELLKVRELKISYGAATAVAGLSFDVRAGEILCIAGESGCGKTSVLRALMGVDDRLRVEGEIDFEGAEIAHLSPARRRALCGSGVAMIAQSPGASFNPLRRYGVQLAEMLKSHGLYRRDAFAEDVARAFSRLGLNDPARLLRRRPFELSGGMNQRVAIAAAMLLRPRLLLADEPVSALDAAVRRQVADALLRLRAESGVAQIIVTHDLGLAAQVADRIGVMYAGRMVELGDARALLSRPAHPYARALLDAIPRMGGPLPKGLDGQPPLDGAQMPGCAFRARCPRATRACADAPRAMTERAPGHFSACWAEIPD